MKIGYLGPEGTYTQQATEELVRKLKLGDVEKLPLSSIECVLESLDKNEIDSAVVPLRNNLAGDYMETIKGLQRYNFNKIDSLKLQIKLAFGIHPETDKVNIREIISKDTALKECSKYLVKHYPNSRLIEVESTAAAMQIVADKKERNAAAIGSESGMKLYGLKIVNDDVGNEKDNFTAFVYLTKLL